MMFCTVVSVFLWYCLKKIQLKRIRKGNAISILVNVLLNKRDLACEQTPAIRKDVKHLTEVRALMINSVFDVT